jgi:thiol-disulfide isomerase/thioredoxin
MKNLLILLLVSALCATAVPALAQAKTEAKTTDTKPKMLPIVSLKNIEGKEITTESLAKSGKITVISFWATWCTPCKKELNNIAEFYGEWQKEYGVQVVAVSIDDAQTAARVSSYVNASNWQYTVLLDANQDLKRAMNIQSIPYTILLNAQGEIVYSHEGYVEGDEYALEDQIRKIIKK